MANIKISQLSSLSTLTDTTVFSTVDASTNYKLAGSVLKTYVRGSISLASPATASDGGALGYVPSTGVFTFTPADKTNLVNGSATATLNTSGQLSSTMFLASEGSYGTTGYSFTDDGGTDTGMFSSGDGQIQFYSNTVKVAEIISTGSVFSIATKALVGTNANFTDWANTKVVVSQADTGHTHAYNMGVVGEAVAHVSDTAIWGVGVYGRGNTNVGTRSAGILGDGGVTNSSDTASAIGVRGYADDTHAGGFNVGLYGSASNGASNYALYMNAGDIYAAANQTWYLNGTLTFNGTNVVTVPTLKVKDVRDTVYAATFASTFTPDGANGAIQNVTLTGSITINAFANPQAGQTITLILTQGGSGNYTLTSSMKFAGGLKTLSTAVGSVDLLTITYTGSVYYASLVVGFV